MRLAFITYSNLPDEALIRKIAAGSSKAFDALYARYSKRLFAYFFRMLWKNKELAEDFTQDMFVKVINHAHGFKEGARVSSWLFSIAHNMCKNEYRKQQGRFYVPLETTETNYSTMPEDMQIDLKTFRSRLDILLETLDEEKKALFIMRFEDQMTVPEIAEILDIPEGTVKSKLFYLLKILTTELKAYHPAKITR